MAIPPLVLRIYTDSTGVKKGVAQANAQVGGLRASVMKNANLIKVGLAAAVVVGFAKATQAAADLGESQNKANVVFGKSVGLVNDFASAAASGFGLAKAEALEGAASFGAMFDSAGLAEEAASKMSVTMAGLAGDMASFNNQDPTEMLDRLRSGLSGEAEPLRRFGVFISEARVQTEAYASGIAKAGQELTDAQKIQARYNIILKDTKKQQGDFARTAGTSLPNQLRVLRAQAINAAASLGKIFLPAITGILKAVNAVLGPLGRFADFIAATIPSAEANAAALEKVGQAFRDGALGADAAAEFLLKYGAIAGWSRDKTEAMIASLKGFEVNTKAAQAAAERFLPFLRQGTKNAAQGYGLLRQKAHQFLGLTQKEQKEWAGKAIEGFDAVGTALDNLANKTKLTAQKIINQFNRQAENIRNYRSNLETVAQRNIPDALLQQLVDMGTGGANILAELAGASDRKFNQMVRAMGRARAQNQKLLDDLARLRREAEAPVVVNIHFQQQGNPNPQQRQHGGPVERMRPYIVGERGPELFVPDVPGTIVPHHQLAPTGTDGAPIHVTVMLGDESLGTAVAKGLRHRLAKL